MSDPHEDDECLVCGRPSSVDGPTMHPVVGFENGVLCQDCIDNDAPSMAEYQEWTEETAMGFAATSTLPEDVPDKWGKPWVVAFLVLAINGESGELAEEAKRVLRGDGEIQRVGDEVGDVFWYLARLADELDMSLADIAAENMGKLEDRKERDVIAGSGDDR